MFNFLLQMTQICCCLFHSLLEVVVVVVDGDDDDNNNNMVLITIINDYAMVPRPLLDMRWTSQSINNQ